MQGSPPEDIASPAFSYIGSKELGLIRRFGGVVELFLLHGEMICLEGGQLAGCHGNPFLLPLERREWNLEKKKKERRRGVGKQ